jgi:cellulose synthase operon protein B
MLYRLMLCGLIVGLLAWPPAWGHAQGTAAGEEAVSFARLGKPEYSLRGPFDAAYVDFSLPADWELRGGASLQLHLALFVAGTSSAEGTPTAGAGRAFGGTLQVQLNNITLGTVLLDQGGERAITIPISSTALLAPREDGRHVLSMLLDTHEPCGSEQFTTLVIRPSSSLALPHRAVAPPTDLALLPRPIYQRAFQPDTATVVVPDAPTDGELQAALAVAAGFGRMTDGRLMLSLVPIGRLTDDMRDNAHLIFVGKPAAFPILDAARLPAPAQGSGFEAPGMSDGDGVVQMAVSPWNTSKVLLIAGGSDDSAVIKAAQAIGSGAIRTGDAADLALVAAVQPQATAGVIKVDRTLADLGYGVQNMYGLGGQYAGYRFDIPTGQAIDGDAYIDLVFVHSAMLDYDQSSVTVSLNNEPIASVRLDDTSTRLGSTRVTLPGSAMQAGSNQLTFRADLLPRVTCVDPRGSGLWMSIRPETMLHLPLGPAPASEITQTIDLSRYPAPFTARPNFGGLAFVLAAEDPASWHVAADIAFDLGRQSQGAPLDLVVVVGDTVPEQVRKERDLLLIGRPSTLPLIGELRSTLPAPFEPDADVATEPGVQVAYRMQPGTSIGYLELLPAPWSAERTVLAVLGSTDEGLGWAGAALTMPRLRSQVSGNLVVIDGEQVESRDTRPKHTEAEQEPPATDESTPAPTAQRPSTVMLLGVATAALVVLGGVVGLAIWWWRRRVRRRASADAHGEP